MTILCYADVCYRLRIFPIYDVYVQVLQFRQVFLKKSIVFKKLNRTFWLNVLFYITHTILAVPPMHKDGKTPRYYPSGSMLEDLTHKTCCSETQIFDCF